MSELLGTPGEYGRITEELQGVIFRDPREASADDPLRGWHTADDYLSGNVRDKLMVARMAAATDPAYAVNAPEVQGVLQNAVGAGPVCAVGHIRHDIVPPCGVLARDLPLRGGG